MMDDTMGEDGNRSEERRRHCATSEPHATPNLEVLFMRVLADSNKKPNPVDTTTITLPGFVPGRDDPARWVEDVSNIVVDLEWSDAIILSKISNSLTGEAGEWFSNWQPIHKRT